MTDFMTDDVIDLDFSGVKAISFGPLPSGDYILQIAEVTKLLGKASGEPYLNIKFQVLGSADGNTIDDGKNVWHRVSLSQKALPFAKPFFDAIMDTDGPVQISTSHLVGIQVGAVLGQSSYTKNNQDGSTEEIKNNKIDGFFKVGNQ